MWAPAQQLQIDAHEQGSSVFRPSSAAASLSTPSHRLAFSVAPKRPPTFTCCLSPDGQLHVAVAEGMELRWSVVQTSGSGTPLVSSVLSGHQEEVTALAFLYHSTVGTTLLVSASSADVLLHWQRAPFTDDGMTDAADFGGHRCVGLLSPAAEGLDPVTHLTLYAYDGDIWFAASAGQECVVGMIPTGLLAGTGGKPRIACRTKGHEAAITATAFLPASGATTLLLVSASDDRTLKVWDIGAAAFVYSTPIVSAAPFTSLATHPTSCQVAAGAADGRLWLYTLSAREQRGEQTQPSWVLESVAMISLAPKTIALRSASHERVIDATPEESIPVIFSKPQWKQSVPLGSVLEDDSSETTRSGDAEDGEATFSVSALMFAALAPPPTGNIGLVATGVTHVLAATATVLLHVNLRNHSVATLFPFARGGSHAGEGMGIARNVVCCATSGTVMDDDDPTGTAMTQREHRRQRMQMQPAPDPHLQIACGVSAAFEPVLAVFTLPVSSTPAAGAAATHQAVSTADTTAFTNLLNFVDNDAAAEERAYLYFPVDSATGDELLEGPIGRGLRLSAQCSGAKVGGERKPGRGRKAGKLIDKPTTFHTRIASSGYGRDNGTHARGRGRSRGRRGVGKTATGGAERRREHTDVRGLASSDNTTTAAHDR